MNRPNPPFSWGNGSEDFALFRTLGSEQRAKTLGATVRRDLMRGEMLVAPTRASRKIPGDRRSTACGAGAALCPTDRAPADHQNLADGADGGVDRWRPRARSRRLRSVHARSPRQDRRRGRRSCACRGDVPGRTPDASPRWKRKGNPAIAAILASGGSASSR
jgi:hypothetical protein